MDVPQDTQIPSKKANVSVRSTWLRVLACLASVIIVCGIKNYLAVIVSGTALCPYLCPSLFPSELFFSFPLLEQLVEAQRWAQGILRDLADSLIADPWNLSTALLIAPVYEEVVFRGPMYLTRRFSRSFLWWLAGIALSLVFALSHGRNGLALVPLFALGICGVWLIATTFRFWPAVALHFLHNFFFSSARVYQSFTFGDY